MHYSITMNNHKVFIALIKTGVMIFYCIILDLDLHDGPCPIGYFANKQSCAVDQNACAICGRKT